MLLFQLFAFAPLVKWMGAVLLSQTAAVRCLIWQLEKKIEIAHANLNFLCGFSQFSMS